MSIKNFGTCPNCDKHDALLFPLHGDKGGPLRCLTCGTEWHAKRSRQRKLGRVVIKAMKAYESAGGSFSDFDKMKLASWGVSIPGFNADTIGAEIGDITSELLADAIQLTHPDKHPPEREDLAKHYLR